MASTSPCRTTHALTGHSAMQHWGQKSSKILKSTTCFGWTSFNRHNLNCLHLSCSSQKKTDFPILCWLLKTERPYRRRCQSNISDGRVHWLKKWIWNVLGNRYQFMLMVDLNRGAWRRPNHVYTALWTAYVYSEAVRSRELSNTFQRRIDLILLILESNSCYSIQRKLLCPLR